MFAPTVRRGLQTLAQASQHLENPCGWDKVIDKLKIIGGKNGKCTAELKIEKEHINLHGGIHGGVTASIVNNMCKYALITKPTCLPGDTIDMQILYLDAPKAGEELLITADTLRMDDKTAYIECEIRTKATDAIVAKGSQTKYISFT